jgi:phosphatidyl-myo-inositol dimannoside synthase
MDKRNILLVAGVFPPGIGGMQNYYYNLCRFSKHKITVLASRYEGDEAFDAKQSFRVIRKPFLIDEKVSVPHILRLFSQVKRIIKQESIDVTVYGYIMFGLIGLILNLLYRKKYTVAVHGLDVLQLTRFFLLRWMVKAILYRSSSVMVNSEYTKRIVQGLGVKDDRIEIVYPGVDESFDRMEKDPVLVERHNLQGKYVLMTLGRLVQRKGFDMVIKSLPDIKKCIPNVVYLVVGNGPEREALEKLVQELGVQEHVVFAGRVSDEDMVKYYNLCDLFVMPSRYVESKGDVEGFGIVYLEAASCFKPAIGGNSGGVVEAVLDGETGILVDPNSTESISSAVVRIYSDKELARKLASQGYKRAKTQFHYRMITKGFDACMAALTMEKKRKLLPLYRKSKAS